MTLSIFAESQSSMNIACTLSCILNNILMSLALDHNVIIKIIIIIKNFVFCAIIS